MLVGQDVSLRCWRSPSMNTNNMVMVTVRCAVRASSTRSGDPKQPPR